MFLPRAAKKAAHLHPAVPLSTFVQVGSVSWVETDKGKEVARLKVELCTFVFDKQRAVVRDLQSFAG